MEGPLSLLLELGDTTRLRVLAAILGKRKNVSSIVSELGLSQPRVSYHLRKLREAGLAVEEKEGRCVWYQANREAEEPHIQELLELLGRWRGEGEGRPVVERPPRRDDEMEDFLL